MDVLTERIRLQTNGEGDIIDLSGHVDRSLKAQSLKEGIVTVFVVGSTAAITTVEYEPGLIKDLPALFEQLAPSGRSYHHDKTWHDGNGHSHVRASLLGPSVVVPFSDGNLLLGTWQQIVLVEFDTRARSREIILQFIGR
jgi:secondary thiamine-phosphate synthase enzyme